MLPPYSAIAEFNRLGLEAISAYEAALLSDYQFNLARVRAQAKVAGQYKDKPSKDALALLIETDPEFQSAKAHHRTVMASKMKAWHAAEVAKLQAWHAVHTSGTP